MFVTNKENLYNTVQTLNNHGRSAKNPKQFWSETVGYKYKISNIQAAIGCGQMKRIDELIEKKREIFFSYHNLLKNMVCIKMNPIPDAPETRYGYWMPTVVFDDLINFDRNKLLEVFKQNNIDARIFFYPLSMLPMFQKKKENIVSYDIYNRAINLPSYHDMSNDDLFRVEKIIQSIYKESTK